MHGGVTSCFFPSVHRQRSLDDLLVKDSCIRLFKANTGLLHLLSKIYCPLRFSRDHHAQEIIVRMADISIIQGLQRIPVDDVTREDQLHVLSKMVKKVVHVLRGVV